MASAEGAFLDNLDAAGAVGYIESGGAVTYLDKTLAAWTRLQDERRQRLDAALGHIAVERLGTDDKHAVDAMHKSLDSLDASITTSGARKPTCSDAQRRDLDYASLRAALVSCYVEHGNQLRVCRSHDRSRHRAAIAARRRRSGAPQGALRCVPPTVACAERRQRNGQSVSPHDRNGRGRRAPARLANRRRRTCDRRPDRRRRALARADPGCVARRQPDRAHRALGLPLRQQRCESRVAGAHSGGAVAAVNQRLSTAISAQISTSCTWSSTLRHAPDKSPLAYTDFLQRGRLTQACGTDRSPACWARIPTAACSR